ncbi:fungal-specific transcription factor domain-containing protein [Mariannaea sp. PMI_226]|nr:fungal-specific transcription factor domain-containing protein [Mariannaea sp. PMI_226]
MSEILFTSYGFLALKGLPFLSQLDAQFLESNGCFHLPLRPVLEEFLRTYFLYVHPCYPLINEAEFWKVYCEVKDDDGSRTTMSLLVLQGMLFASSAFVSPAALKKAGYPGVKDTRSLFYRRAKLLFDLGAERDAFSKAQGAFLLTYQFSSIDPHVGSHWLSLSIQNALIAQNYSPEPSSSDRALQRRNKRLWWSIYLRDRILALGLRRPIQITSYNFNLQAEDVMSLEDFGDEIYQSEVYSPDIKQNLIDILHFQWCLAIVLTEVLSIAYKPRQLNVMRSREELRKNLLEIDTAKSKLDHWKVYAEAAFDRFLHDSTTHPSVILFTNLTYIYFYAGQIALCHHETLIIQGAGAYALDLHEVRLQQIRDELGTATQETTELVRFLINQGLIQYVPISVIAYFAFPLMVGALDDSLSPALDYKDEDSPSSYFFEAMRLCGDRFEGADDITNMVSQVLESAKIPMSSRRPSRIEARRKSLSSEIMAPDSSLSKNKRSSTTSCWTAVLINDSNLYLRLYLSLDYILATGEPLTTTDLPLFIREGNRKSLNPGPHRGIPGGLQQFLREQQLCIELESALETETQTLKSKSPGRDAIQREGGSAGRTIRPRDVLLVDDCNSTNNRTSSEPMSDARSLLLNQKVSWDYDTAWAGNLFEEMTGILWG